MTTLIIKKNNELIFNIEIKNFMLNEKELTLTIKEDKFIEIPMFLNEMYNITIESDINIGIPEKAALYKSYLFVVTDDAIQQQDEEGNIILEKVNRISSNQLLFYYL
jgi:hypothetical protein